MKHARHFHVSEPDLVPVGTTTDVPHATLGRVLRTLGYEGWCSIEMRGGEDDVWRETLPRAIAVAREAYGGRR